MTLKPIRRVVTGNDALHVRNKHLEEPLRLVREVQGFLEEPLEP